MADDDDYGAELDAMVQETEKKIDSKPAAKKSMFQSAIASATSAQEKQQSVDEPQMQMPDMAEMDKMMQELFANNFGGGGAGGAPPDVAGLTKLLGQFASDETEDVSDEKVQEAQKLFQECLENISKETKEAEKDGETKPQPDLSDPKGEGLGNLGDMFKNFEKIAKEQNTQGETNNQAPQEDPFAKLFANMGQPGAPDEPFDEAQMMNMFQGLLGNLGKNDPSTGGSSEGQPQMDEIFKQFTSFLKDQEGEGDESFKGALDSVVKEIISKDSLYQPMKNLKEEYPKWLEDNWQSLSDEDLERYNKQLDKVTEICELFEKADAENQPKDEVFELLSQLQELGHPPESLMKHIQEKYGLTGPQSTTTDSSMPAGMQDLFANLAKPPTENDQNQPKFNNPFEGL